LDGEWFLQEIDSLLQYSVVSDDVVGVTGDIEDFDLGPEARIPAGSANKPTAIAAQIDKLSVLSLKILRVL